MGTAKLLLPWDDATVIESTIGAWRKSSVDVVVVVVSRNNNALIELCAKTGANVVIPAIPPPDMKASIQAAIRELHRIHAPADRDCFLVAPADMPWIDSATIDRLISAKVDSQEEVIVPVHGGRRGHPVVLSWTLAAEVLALANNESLKTIVDRSNVGEIEWDATILGDLDTPADYQAALAKYCAS